MSDFEESDTESSVSASSFSATPSDSSSEAGSPIHIEDFNEEELELYGIRKSRVSRQKIVESSDEEMSEAQTPSFSGDLRFSNRTQRVNYDESNDGEDDWQAEQQLKQEQKFWTQEDWLMQEGNVIDKVLDWKDDKFLVKWLGRSHLHNTWETLDSIKGVKGFKKVQNYKKKVVQPYLDARHDPNVSKEELEQMDIQFEMERDVIQDSSTPERIVDYRKGEEDEFYVKWKRCDYSECTWEKLSDLKDVEPLIQEYWDRKNSELIPSNSNNEKFRGTFPGFGVQQPNYIAGGKLRDYQLKGVGWGANLWHRDENGILADEMGLGKTVQTISILNYLFSEMKIYGPFLVVVPLSTMGSWQREFAKWAPQMNVVVYQGNQLSRDIIRRHEMWFEGQLSFNVLLTTYEMVVRDKDVLGQIKWRYLAVDEAHRLKNQESQIHDALSQFHTANRLLITGTPLQNNVQELVSLIKFLMPGQFKDLEDVDITIGEDSEAQEKIEEFHHRLRPFMIRRLKKDVEKDLPQKTEMILRVELAPLQRRYYRNVLARNYQALATPDTKPRGLLNIVMELKKTSDHPFLIHGADTGAENKSDRLRDLITNSGKMVLLDKLLMRLKQDGHRVLIFSQLVMMLDLLSEYMSLRNFTFERLDGSTPSDVRRRAIENFNKPDSPHFCFLLSTRAGGLGINLETADTVILFDSDWNPQNDLQAMARAHRIGQKNHVNVYRFVSKDTIEEDILERAKKKMVLEYSIMRKMDKKAEKLGPDAYSASELQNILKFGAQNLFKATDDNSNLDNLNLDDVLARAEAHDTEDLNEDSEFMSAFQVADFGANQLNWDDIIPEEERRRIAEEERLERERLRAEELAAQAALKKKKEEERAAMKLETKDVKVEKQPKKKGPRTELNRKDLDALVKGMRKYGDVARHYDRIVADSSILNNVEKNSVLDCGKRLLQACQLANNQATKEVRNFLAENILIKDPPVQVVPKEGTPVEEKKGLRMISLDFGECTQINVTNLLDRCRYFASLDRELKALKDVTSFRLLAPMVPTKDWATEWGVKEDSMLLVGVWKYGIGSWEAIAADESLGLGGKMFLKDEHDEKGGKKLPGARNLVTRAEAGLKAVHEGNKEGKKREASGQESNAKRVKVDKGEKGEKHSKKDKGEKVHKEKVPKEKHDSQPSQKLEKPSEKIPNKKASELLQDVLPFCNALKGGMPEDKMEGIQFLKDNVIPIGQKITELVKQGHSEEEMWEFVTGFWWTSNTWDKVKHLYTRLAPKDKTSPV